ncbi:thrombospondin-related protein, putative [Babesia ovis]|uniref:Thrombospondin-related protein, putative n=1 Tax=Babesia ovis TaxID=5869 RepID=A0A9W5TAQ4_BABOV|nr:thrombospondin-related protein, putative [Babesia ovis]
MIGYTKILACAPILHLLLLISTGIQAAIGDDFDVNTGNQCTKQLDFSIVVDESGSITESQWNKQMIPFLKNLIQTIDLDNSDIRLSLITYSTPTRQIINFLDEGASNTKLALNKLELMRRSKATSGMTYTGRALNFVRKAILPYGRKNVPKALLLITDGGSSDGSYAAQIAATLRDEGVSVMVIGVGNANVEECRGIVGCDGIMECPMFKHTQWSDIIKLFHGLMKEVCDILPQDAECTPIWGEWSECNGECNATGKRTRTLLDLQMIQKPIKGANGKPGQSCEEQKMNYLPETESCVRHCVHNPLPIEETKPTAPTVTDDITHYPINHKEEPDVTIDQQPTLPVHDTGVADYPHHIDSGMTADDAVTSKPYGDIPLTQPYDDLPEYLPGYNGPTEDDSSTPYDYADSHEDEALRYKLETQREEDLLKELQMQHELKLQIEKEKAMAHKASDQAMAHKASDQAMAHKASDQAMEHKASDQAIEHKALEQPTTPESHKSDSVSDTREHLIPGTPKQEEYESNPEDIVREGTSSYDSEDQEETEKPKDDSSGRSTSNATKIAGGTLLGLLLVGAGGGYAMYKKNKAPTMEPDSGDYTGAEESSQPMKDGETYTVTEFDNNIWGEAA